MDDISASKGYWDQVVRDYNTISFHQLYKLDKHHHEHALSIQSFYSKLRLVILRVKRLYANLSIIISFGSLIQREPCQRKLLFRADSWYARDESHVQSIQRVASVYADPLHFLTPSLKSA